MRKILVTIVAAAAAAAAMSAPAAAATTTATFAPTHAKVGAAHARGFNINGQNWGGAAATGSGFTSVSATWVEPSATCHSTNDLYAPWAGIDGYGSTTVEQTGVATDCSSGSAVDEPWYEMYPAAPVYLNTSQYPASAGDSITATVTYSSTFTVKLTNNTRGWTFTTSKAVRRAQRASAEVIIESPSASYPNFGTIQFTNCTINGQPLANANPALLDPSNRGTYEAHTSAVSGGNFSIQFEHQ
jgi:hypothetical protein